MDFINFNICSSDSTFSSCPHGNNFLIINLIFCSSKNKSINQFYINIKNINLIMYTTFSNNKSNIKVILDNLI